MTYEELQPKIEAILKVEVDLYQVTTAHLLCRDEVGHGVQECLAKWRASDGANRISWVH
jgi:hypothetical protein